MNTPLKDADPTGQAGHQHLTDIANEWQLSGLEPRDAADLSRDEYRALCVAVGRPQLLLSPVIDFVALPEDLQRWSRQYFDADSKRRRLDEFQQTCERQDVGAERVRATMVEHLASIAAEWRSTGTEPAQAGSLSRGEYAAVCLAARPSALMDPVRAFLDLDGWLQVWVLHQRGMPSYVGMVVGHPFHW